MSKAKKYVYGPYFVKYLQHPEKEQLLIIFGEYHSSHDEKCKDLKKSTEISSYLVKLLNTFPDHFFDFFIELSYDRYVRHENPLKYYFGSSESMNNITNTFGDCIVKVAKCPYNNVRIHLADPRTGMEEKELDKFSSIYTYLFKEDMNLEKNQEGLKNIVKNGFDKTDFTKDAKQLIKLLTKEWVRINPSMRRYVLEITDFFDFYGYLDKVSKDLQKLYNALENFEVKKLEKYKRLFNKVGNDISHNLFMDAYTSLRIMHEFKDKDNPTVKNAVVYAGGNHSELISKFFEDIGYKEIFQSDLKDYSQCVQILTNKQLKKYLV